LKIRAPNTGISAFYDRKFNLGVVKVVASDAIRKLEVTAFIGFL